MRHFGLRLLFIMCLALGGGTFSVGTALAATAEMAGMVGHEAHGGSKSAPGTPTTTPVTRSNSKNPAKTAEPSAPAKKMTLEEATQLADQLGIGSANEACGASPPPSQSGSAKTGIPQANTRGSCAARQSEEARKKMQAVKELMFNPPPLPQGDYRDHCMQCGIGPGVDGEPILSCACLVGDSPDLAERSPTLLRLTMTNCAKDAPVSYCYGTLTCGPCPKQKTPSSGRVDPKKSRPNDMINQLFPPQRR